MAGAVEWENLMMLEVSKQPVSVIIVNYNGGALLIDCVREALLQVEEVIVVDNASSDTSMSILVEQFSNEPRLMVQLETTNLGFAAGCNLGISLSTQQYLLFLNPDCLIGANSVYRMVEVLEIDPSTGMVGGLLTNPDGSEQGGGRRAIPTPWRSFVRAFGLTRFRNRFPKLFFDFHLHRQTLPAEPIDVEAISGALMLVRRAAIDDVGLWDETYFLHCEDLDWCMRFRQRGWRILFIPDAPVLHHKGHSSKARPFFVEWHKHKGMQRFYKKFFQQQYPGPLMWLVNVGIWFRFVSISIYYSIHLVISRLKSLSVATNLWKRIFDLSLAFTFSIVLILPLCIVALLVRVTSKGPILYWSDRVGQNNTLFRMPKFRTMRIGTPAVATHLLLDPTSYLTPIGSFLRKSSLDELPQLWSILKGDMSFVGPRPALFNQDDLIALRTQNGVCALLPGLTGWAQVNGRDELPIPEKVALDTHYLNNQSFWLDIRILWMTFLKVLKREGVSH
jgi:lipopolysaccharide/colanic/teichoic acid biosynthesis glycosyltransferase